MNMTIAQRLYGGFSLVIAMILLVTGIIWYQSQSVSMVAQEVESDDVPGAILYLQVLDELGDMQSNVLEYLAGEGEEVDDFEFNYLEFQTFFSQLQPLEMAGQLDIEKMATIERLVNEYATTARVKIFQRFNPETERWAVDMITDLEKTTGRELEELLDALKQEEFDEATRSTDLKESLKDDLPGVRYYLELIDEGGDMLSALNNYMDGELEMIEQFEEDAASFQLYLDALRPLEKKPEEIRNLAKIETLFTRIKNTAKKVFSRYDPTARGDALKTLDYLEHSIFSKVEEILDTSAAEEKDDASLALTRVNDSLSNMGFMLLIVIPMILVLAGFVLWFIRNNVVASLNDMTGAMQKLAAGELDTDIPGVDREDEMGLMADAAQVFKESLQSITRQNWVQENAGIISAEIQKSKTLKEVGETIMHGVTPLLDGAYAAFYLYDDDNELLTLEASYAYKERKNISNSFKLGEGLVGQCGIERKPIILTQVPDDYIKISSGLGEASPQSIASYPVVLQDRLIAVIEVASFDAISPRGQSLLEVLIPVIALYIENLNRSLKTEELLVKTRAQSEELRKSEAELIVREEELKSTNESLQQQTKALEGQAQELAASEEELRTQQEELRATNEELLNKTKALELQQKDLAVAKEKTDEYAEEVVRSSQYKSQFLANMSHELRTPLNSLLILAKGLADNDSGELCEDDLESAAIIHDSGTRLLHLINDILDLSKIEAGEVEFYFERVDPNSFIQFVDRFFSPVAEDKGLTLSLNEADNLPEVVVTDSSKVEQVLSNLLSNAFKFTHEGGVTVSLQAVEDNQLLPSGCNNQKKYLTISVEDTGVGVPKDKQNLIFEAFKQSDGSTSREYGGTGLGLSISLRLAELLGGGFLLTSEEGRGSCFTLYLPIDGPDEVPVNHLTGGISSLEQGSSNQDSSGQASSVPGSAPALAPPVPVKKPRVNMKGNSTDSPSDFPMPVKDDRDDLSESDRVVVVIEDDLEFCKILLDRTHRKGFKSVVAVEGETGLRMVKYYKPVGIVLDIGLPNMDGWSVLGQLKDEASTRHIPVHIFSAEDDYSKGLELGAVGFDVKPITQAQIEGALAKINHMAPGEEKQLLIVEDDAASRKAITKLLAQDDVKMHMANSAESALAILERESIDCMILDLGLPGMSGFELLDAVRADENLVVPPVVVYSGRDLTPDEKLRIREYTDSIVIKGTRSPERLLDEVTLFLHSVVDNLPASQKMMLKRAQNKESAFDGKRVLIVDDDVRNMFALSKSLRAKGFSVDLAKDGLTALEKLKEDKHFDLVLMDVMMPGMDGFEATREIRKMKNFAKLPIISITAKAMRGDREKCIEAGSNDYLPKPVDMDKLLSMMRVWL